MQSTIVMAAIACVWLSSCTRDEDRSRFVQAPTAQSDEPVPPVRSENGAPLNNAAGYPQQLRNTEADEQRSALGADSDRTGSGKLVAAPGRKIQGEVELHEVGQAVRVELEVERAIPGTRRVVFTRQGDCEALLARDERLPVREGIGAIAIDEAGRGEVTLSIPGANLRPDSSDSLLRGALVLYAPERVASASKPREVAVACATITTG